MRAAQSEFDHRVVAGGGADASRFGRDEGGEVDEVEEGAFEELALDKGALDAYERFIGVDDIAFGDRVYAA